MAATLAVRAIVVADLEESIAFYRDVFGFETADLFEGSDPALDAMTQLDNVNLRAQLIRNADGVVFELVQFVNPQGFGSREADTIAHYGLTHLAFVVDDVDASRELAIARGGKALDQTRVIVEDADTAMDGMFVADPNGVRIELAKVKDLKTGFLWNGINVKNLEKAIDYYRIFGMEPAESFDLREARPWVAKLNEIEGMRLFVQVVRDNQGNAIELIEMHAPQPSTYKEPRIYNGYGLANLAFFTDDRDSDAAKMQERGGVMFDQARIEIQVNDKMLKQWHGMDPNGVRVELVQHPR